MKKQNGPNTERGFILLTVVVAITLVAAIALALSYQGASETNIASGEIQRDQLRYITQAGMAHAKSQLSPNDTCDSYTQISSTPFGAGTYTTSISPTEGSPVTVTATGSLQNGAQYVLSRDDTAVYSAAITQSIKLQPGSEGQDTYIEADRPSDNYGGQGILMTDGETGGPGPIRALLRFDLSSIPTSSNVFSAEIRLYVTADATTPPVVQAHRVLREWVEGTGSGDGASWNTTDGSTAWSTPGADYDAGIEGSFVADSLGWKTLDLTSLVQSWVGGNQPNYGLILLSPPLSGNNEITYHSSDASDPTLRPKLLIVANCECGKACSASDNTIYLSTDGSAQLGGLSFLDKDLVEYDRSGDIGTLFLDSAAVGLGKKIDALHVLEDGHLLLSVDADTTFGGLSFKKEDLIEYDPVAGTATMFLEAEVHFQSKQNIVSVHMLDSGNIVLSTAGSATLGGLAFSDRDLVEYNRDTGQASIFFDGDATTLSKKIFAVHVRENGNIVLGTDGDTTLGGLSFGKDQLIDYDPVADTATLFFDGSVLFSSTGEALTAVHVGPGSGQLASAGVATKVLFVVGSVGGAGPTAEEMAHQTLIESWGHTVEFIDDDASQADFDAAVANNDVIFATNDITASALNTKVVDATIGVVTSEVNLSDEFGMASTIGWDSGTVVEINDNTHYITSPFSIGLLTVFSSSESLAFVSGTQSPELGKLASSSSGFGVVTLEAGASMYGGGSAAGRRAQLPWGGNGFDPNNLTADGLTILQRAIEWGAGNNSLDIQVTDGNDDAEELSSDGTMYLTSSDLELADNLAASGQPTDIVGIRFAGVTIPQGASVTEAYIQFQVDELNSGAASLTIEAETTDDAAPFTAAAFDISSRPRTTASALWTPPDWTTIGERGPDQRTVDISAVIQEIVDRPGWASGNALAVIISGSGTRTAEAFEGDPAGAPTLHVEFGGSGGGGGGGGGSCDGNFRDNFDNTVFNGSNGTLSWATDWIEVGESDGATSGDIQVMTDQSNYQLRTRDNDNGGEGAEREADLSGAATAALNYDYRRMNLDSASDYTSVEVSANGASGPWTELTRHDGSGNDSSYQPASHDITAYKSANTRIRFITSSSMGGTDTVWFDNIEIACSP